ncbi:putative signal transducing protein [Xanthomonas sp. NCPPB 3582]|uniref:putative signal transducing protein n=1 Tax=Xanthomonas sp. NCPPB 3582 TaxID=487557 RepID=UPI003556205C
MSTWLTLVSYDNALQARLVAGRLQAEGIAVYLADEQQCLAQWYLCQALGGIKIRVEARHWAQARAVLADLEAGAHALPEGADEAPLPHARHDTLSARLALLVLSVLAIPLPWRRR